MSDQPDAPKCACAHDLIMCSVDDVTALLLADEQWHAVKPDTLKVGPHWVEFERDAYAGVVRVRPGDVRAVVTQAKGA